MKSLTGHLELQTRSIIVELKTVLAFALAHGIFCCLVRCHRMSYRQSLSTVPKQADSVKVTAITRGCTQHLPQSFDSVSITLLASNVERKYTELQILVEQRLAGRQGFSSLFQPGYSLTGE